MPLPTSTSQTPRPQPPRPQPRRARLSRTQPPPAGPLARGAHPAPTLSIGFSCLDADTITLTLVGEADLSTVAELRQALSDAIGTGHRHLIVDLDSLTFLDATTLGALAAARVRAAEAGGTLKVWCRTRMGQRLLSITGLSDMLDCRVTAQYPTTDE